MNNIRFNILSISILLPALLFSSSNAPSSQVEKLTNEANKTTTISSIKPTAKIETPTLKKVADKSEPKNNTKVQIINTASGVVEIVLPTVPKAIQLNPNSETVRKIKFSKRVPPNYIKNKIEKEQKSQQTTNLKIGEESKGRISAHLRGEFMDADAVKETLKKAGFEVIASVPVNKKKTLISVVFTDKNLLSMASKKNRGFMASLRVLIDTKDKYISITNPVYMAKGFLQKDFDEKSAKSILSKLITGFPNLKNSKDSLKYQLLPKYQFMNGMPYYQDMIEVASGTDLLEKIKDNKKVVFTQTLSNGSTLIGIKLSKRTRKFTKRIGRKNAAMLPYPILIEDGKAMILDPKYYISYMYPLLKMSEFMTIATIPDAMIKDCEKVFKKRKKKK